MKFLLAFALLAADWPQFLGPTRDGIAPGPRPGTKAELMWKQDVGHGFAGPVIADNRLILFERVNSKESISARDLNTGKKLWTYDYDTRYQDDFGFDDGPRSAPTISSRQSVHFWGGRHAHLPERAERKKDLECRHPRGLQFQEGLVRRRWCATG